MKKVISIVLQTILLLIAYIVGLFLHPFHITQVLISSPAVTRTFVWDGILLMLTAYVLILLIEAARKRLPTSAAGSTIALVLAAILALASKLGFVTQLR